MFKDKYIVIEEGQNKRNLAYIEWGEETNPNVLFCVHGLIRNSRDFDYLAKELLPYYRIICPDIAGRGKSSWLNDHEDYYYHLYTKDMLTLIVHLGVKKIDWVGTSMGGIIGMKLAADNNGLIRKLVLNDIGPSMPITSLKKITNIITNKKEFDDLKQAEDYIRYILSHFGIKEDEHWEHLALHGVTLNDEGKYILAFDPKISHIFGKDAERDVEMLEIWDIWEKIDSKIYVLRGKKSAILLKDTLEQMLKAKPDLKYAELEGIGHNPSLMEEGQINIVKSWLLD